jgi:hypothetical protein
MFRPRNLQFIKVVETQNAVAGPEYMFEIRSSWLSAGSVGTIRVKNTAGEPKEAAVFVNVHVGRDPDRPVRLIMNG